MKKIILVFILLLPNLSHAQTDYSNDVKSVDAIIAALYDVISGEAGKARDWKRFKNLFTADARLIPTRKNDEGKLIYRVITPDEYVQMFNSRIATGFFERELHREAEDFGTIIHAFSTYETKEKKDGPITNRGINSIQIFYDGSRYYVMHVFWCAESLGFTLPEKYLSK
ncbi:MAG TPA: hypothetical protein VFU05_09570 [Cyclobacteriaceae bacterium]|nr:hypothetical protein [Cyclobacteriaceae bacterium]